MSVSRRVALVLLGGTLCGACAPSSPARAKPTGATPAATIAPESNVPGGLTIGATPPAAAAPTPNAPPRSTPGPPAPEAAATTAGREEVLPGVDVLMRERLDVLAGRKLGLLTNATGLDRGGRSTIDVLRGESSWQLVALFSPEHGIRGDADAGATVDSGVDPQTGLPVYSLYGQTTRPTPQM
ncbi:MAG TPA: exo-beta-N-acetylmuramidase NamZ domain-containing protein, partial [Chloroflexota bacterium]|nr:exo-beta-N-acetylmuramidase NamZ domain-containing protein [Chloroflexota bacterium]